MPFHYPVTHYPTYSHPADPNRPQVTILVFDDLFLKYVRKGKTRALVVFGYKNSPTTNLTLTFLAKNEGSVKEMETLLQEWECYQIEQKTEEDMKDSEDPKVDDHLKIGEQPKLDLKPAKSPKKISKVFALENGWHLQLDKIFAIGPLEISRRCGQDIGSFSFYLASSHYACDLDSSIKEQYDALVQAWTQYHEEN